MAEDGEVSGNKDDFMKKCSPCLKKGTEKGAEKYCYACKTFFCGNCIELHDALFSEHRLTNTGSVDIDVALTLHTEVCQQHGKPLILYCKDDKTIGCEMCVASEHGSCQNIAYLPKEASNIIEGIAINDVKAKLQETIQRFEAIDVSQQTTISDIEADRDCCLQEIDTYAEDLSSRVNKIVKASKDKVIQKFERLHSELQKHHQEVKKCLVDLKTNEKQLERKQGNDVELLLEIKKQEKQEQLNENIFSKVMESLQVTGFTVAIDNRLYVILSDIESLVTVSLKGAVVKVTKRREVDISDMGEKTSHVIGSCVLPDGSIILVDNSSNILKRLDQQSFRVIDQCLIYDKPIDICCIDWNTVAVTQENKKVAFVTLSPRLSITLSIQMSHPCEFVTYSRGELFINDNSQSLYVYDMKGSHLRTITRDVPWLFSDIQHMVVSDDKLYVADGYKGLMILDRQGKLLDTLLTKDKLSLISDACLDGVGGLFVAGLLSDNVVHVGADGKILTEVLSGSDGLLRPLSVCYDRVRKRLFVSQSENNQLHVCEFE